jgi:hypothetical protein
MTQSGTPSSTPDTATTSSPTGPPLGGMIDGTVSWIGGPPNRDFSGPSRVGPSTPLCWRGTDASSAVKGYISRTTGSVTKFKRDDETYTLLSFADVALKHMVKTGMDTIFFMTGAGADGTGAMELFTYHTRYTKAAVDSFIQARLADGSYCGLQATALTESGEWLFDSLDESLKNTLRNKFKVGIPGPVAWMLIVSEVQSASLDRCDRLATEFKAMQLVDFKGENVDDYVASAEAILLTLQRDDQLPRLHLLHIVDVFSACTVMDFKIHWMGRRAAVQSFLRDAAGKDPSVVEAMPTYMSYTTLLDEGKEIYTDMKTKWGASTKTPETSLMASLITDLQAQVGQLDQRLRASPATPSPNNGQGNGRPPIQCYGCGAPGVIQSRCTRCNPNGGSNGEATAAKWAPPGPGESEERIINGHLHYFCSRCKRWRKGDGKHKTAQHRVGVGAARGAPGGASNDGNNESATPAPAANLSSLPSSGQTLFSLSHFGIE